MRRSIRAIGFSTYQKKQDIEEPLRRLTKKTRKNGQLPEREDSTFYELQVETASGVGVVMAGGMNPKGTFNHEYYFPYMKSTDISSDAKCSIQCHTERETFAGLLDEYRVGIPLIFYIENPMEYRLRKADHKFVKPLGAALPGLCMQGRILLPIQETEKQAEDSRVAARKRNNLLGAAKCGDEDAIETLAIEDIDLYSIVSKWIAHEDIYPIVETCFMSCDIECDQYSIIGEITRIGLSVDRITKEEVCDLTLDCSDMIFRVIINRQDLLGEPKVSRRFKGQAWVQGIVQSEA